MLQYHVIGKDSSVKTTRSIHGNTIQLICLAPDDNLWTRPDRRDVKLTDPHRKGWAVWLQVKVTRFRVYEQGVSDLTGKVVPCALPMLEAATLVALGVGAPAQQLCCQRRDNFRIRFSIRTPCHIIAGGRCVSSGVVSAESSIVIKFCKISARWPTVRAIDRLAISYAPGARFPPSLRSRSRS